jgi:hypothetical protein
MPVVKGLILSLLVLVLYVGSTAVTAHVLRPRRYLRLFLLASLPCGVAYFILYTVTPRDLYFLPSTWTGSDQSFDMAYGFAVLLLNCHSFVDYFFGTCGGFSVSLLVAILDAGAKPITTADLSAKFKLESETESRRMAPGVDSVDMPAAPQESNRIYAWRLPYLVKQGWIRKDPQADHYSLTNRGRIIARIVHGLKRSMNLGEGG